VLATLGETGIRTVAIGGAALAETVYDEPALRHCHDLDLLVEAGDVTAAAALLTRRGFRPARSGGALLHETGLPVVVHGRFVRRAPRDLDFEEVWGRSSARELGGAPARVPSAADQLLRVCARMSSSRARSPRWACDAWLLVADGEVEWELLLESASRTRLAPRLAVALEYLAGRLDAPIPATFLRELPRPVGRRLTLARR
jgi:hypothetical protein